MRARGYVILLVLILIAFKADHVLGFFLEGFLENKLSDVFDMPVEISGLTAHPVTGHVTARRIVFHNQPGFLQRPHLDGRELSFDIDWQALRRKYVRIGNAHFGKLDYVIEKTYAGRKGIHNITTWLRHIQRRNRERKEKRQKAGIAESGKSWRTRIGRIAFDDGSFTYERYRGGRLEFGMAFVRLKGFLSGFDYPTEDPSRLTQQVYLEGFFGEKGRSPFKVTGMANFATSHVSFNLYGEVPEGYLEAHPQLWEGLPVEVRGGTYGLTARALCVERKLTATTQLVLHSPELVSGPGVTDKIWGLPLSASVGFLKNQDTVHLTIPVRGNLTDPKFDINRAFQKAFQEALSRKTRSGFEAIGKGSRQIVDQTRVLVGQTQERLVKNIEKIGSLVSVPAGNSGEEGVS